MKSLQIVFLSLAIALSLGCSSTGTGPGNTHGEVDVGTAINPSDPKDITVNVGGKIYFAPRKALKPAAH